MTRANVDRVREEVRRILTEAGLSDRDLEWMAASCPTVAAAKAYADGRRRGEEAGQR